jgi:hypothetical protein
MQPRRNPKLGLPTAALLGLALAWAWPGGAADTVLGVHAMLDCRGCHVVGADGAPTVPIELVGTQETICAVCHRDAVEASHATGFIPQRPLPKAYPLDRGCCERESRDATSAGPVTPPSDPMHGLAKAAADHRSPIGWSTPND